MFKKLTNQTTDLTSVYLPEPATVPPQSFPMRSEYASEQYFTAIESRITANTSMLYTDLLDWSNIYFGKFPTQFSALPAVLTRDNKIFLNMDLASVNFNLTKKNISVDEPNDLAAAVLYGVNMLMLKDFNNDNALAALYECVVNFIYSLIFRIYGRDIDVSRMSNDDVAKIYYAIARLVIGNYFVIYGINVNGLAMRMTHNFFTKDLMNRVTYNPGYLPQDADLNTFSKVFSYLDEENLVPSASLDTFRARIIQNFSLTALLCMTNGLTLVSMILASRLPSNVFNDRIGKIRPQSSSQAFSAILKHLTQKRIEVMKEKKEKEQMKNLGWSFSQSNSDLGRVW